MRLQDQCRKYLFLVLKQVDNITNRIKILGNNNPYLCKFWRDLVKGNKYIFKVHTLNFIRDVVRLLYKCWKCYNIPEGWHKYAILNNSILSEFLYSHSSSSICREFAALATFPLLFATSPHPVCHSLVACWP